jgi:hypothetical protein
VSRRAGLNDVEKRKFLTPPGIELRPLGSAARSQSLYRLRYAGCFPCNSTVNNLNPDTLICEGFLSCACIVNEDHGSIDSLCGVVVRVSGYRSRGPEFDSPPYQIF